MSLLTLERSSPSPHESENEDLLSTSSYEGFVAREHYALCLTPRPITSLGPCRRGDHMRIFSHLKKLVKLLRPADKLKLAVELENGMPRKVTKYMVVILTHGNQDTDETIVLGTEQEEGSIRIGLVLPLWRDTEIKLDGDGGFSVHTGDRQHVFKPLSVQSMWTALQTLYKCTEHARMNNYYVGGLSHTWMTYYSSRLTTDGSILNEWNLKEDVESFRPDSPIYTSDINNWNDESVALEKYLSQKLRLIMLEQDLEEVTSKQLRLLLEKETSMELKEYRGFLDRQMLRILGQMERPSQIYDYLYLGSEWNASNLSELKEIGVKYILNITKEIDNFYPEEFKYLNIRLYDLPASELMKHWDKTYKFIKESKLSGKKVLVHCKMGISRSAATVVAYTMKEYNMSLEEALEHVKGKRSVVNPNEGFMQQLKDYEGILRARHNDLWGKKAPSRLHPLQISRKLFHSEPSIPDCTLEQPLPAEPELSFLPEEDLVDPASSPNKWASQSHHQSLALFPPNHAVSIDKRATIQNFLASLPPVVTIEDDQGIGENLYTSESGSGYSTPNLSPTDDEQFNLRFHKLGREISRRTRSSSVDSNPKHNSDVVENQDKSSTTGQKETTCNETIKSEGEVTSNVQTDEQSSPTQALGIPPKPAPPPEPKSRASSYDATVERQQPVAVANQIPFTVKTIELESANFPVSREPSSLSPNVSSNVSLNSLTPFQSLDQIQPVNSEDNPVIVESAPEQARFRLGSEEPEVKSESPVKEPISPSSFHRRAKSDTLNMSGPVEIPQIQSVPERVKEIEQLNSVVGAEGIHSTDGGVPKIDIQPAPVSQFISRNSSVNSLLSSHSQVSCNCDQELEQFEKEQNETSSPPRFSATRHESLSPSPPSNKKSAEHVRHSSLPSSQPALEQSADSELKSSADDSTGSSLVGAVKARVLTIEEKKVKDSLVRKQSITSEKSDASMRSSSPVRHNLSQRPASVAVDGNDIYNLSGGVIRSKTDPKSKGSPLSARASYSPELRAQPRLSRRESTPPAVFSAWRSWISAEDTPPPPVQDLKRKFEESDECSAQDLKPKRGGPLRRSQSLRTVESPKRVSRRAGTSSPEQGSRLYVRHAKH